MLRQKIIQLELLLKRKFPNIPFIFYVSKRKQRVHFALEKALFNYENFFNAIMEIK